MREILFRGKRLDNGEWAYGNPLFYCAGQAGIVQCTVETRILPYCEDLEYHAIEKLFSPKVLKESISQFTGLKDTNGVCIFEGDIVKIAGEDGFFVVTWDTDRARFIMETDGLEVDYDNYWSDETEVVGNIWDNPELIEME